MANDMLFFKIGNTDFSSFVDTQNYEMNSVDVYEMWTDGNWIDHRVVARQRISGKIKLGFSKASDFAAFVTTLATARQIDGSYSITAYVNNLGTTETFSCYIDTEDTDRWDLINSRQWQVQALTITGR